VTRSHLSMNTDVECTLNVLRSRRHCGDASAAISSKVLVLYRKRPGRNSRGEMTNSGPGRFRYSTNTYRPLSGTPKISSESQETARHCSLH
jgi:hypothetical protein